MSNKTSIVEFDYDKKYSFEQRCHDANLILQKYEGKIPVLVQRGNRSRLQKLVKSKYIVSGEFTLAQFFCIIRKNINGITPEQSIWMSINNVIPPSTSTMNSIYNDFKSDDGFLRIAYCEENMFG